MPVEIDEHKLEGGEEDKREEHPQHKAGPPAEGERGGIERDGQQDVHQSVDEGHGLGDGQAKVGQGQHEKGHHEDRLRRGGAAEDAFKKLH